MHDRPSVEKAIVIGAGVLGCGVALELRRAGYDVTVVDRNGRPGHGSTSASSAIVRYHYRHFDEAAVAWESGLRWAHWEEYLGTPDPEGMARFIRTGLLLIEGEMLDLGEALGHLDVLGVQVHELSLDELRQRHPGLDAAQIGPPSLLADDRFWRDGRGVARTWWMPECGYVDDPTLAAHNLAHAAREVGAVFRFNASVIEVTSTGGRVTGVRLEGGETLSAPIVVNVAGPWSRTLNELAGVLDDFHTSTRPLQQEVISLPAPDGFRGGDGAVCVTDADFGTYFRPHGSGSLVVGGMEPPCDPLTWLDGPDDVRPNVSADTWELQSLRVARRVEGLRIPNRPRGVVGVYDVTDDWIPIYDRTGLDGFYVAIGSSGHGFKQAPFVGELMARLVLACESGHPHDSDPVKIHASSTGSIVDLGHFSRLRAITPQAAMG